MRRKSIVKYDDHEEGIAVIITIETKDQGRSLTFSEHKKMQDHLVDDAIFAVRSAPFLSAPPISRFKLS